MMDTDTDTLTYVLEVLEFAERTGSEFEIDWSVEKYERSLRFYYRCNDTYFWGTSDAEEIELGDIDTINKVYEEVMKLLPDESYYSMATNALLVWASRKRGMRPQGCAYPEHKALWPLLDACGPERESGIGCSNKRPEGE